MARVRPFAAYRYAHAGHDLTTLTAPPYDVIDEPRRKELLAQSPHNAVALELPDGPLDLNIAGNRYDTGAMTWSDWRASGVLAQDPAPALYVVEQRFTMHGRSIRRRAFVTEVALEPFSAGIILPHERTLSKALDDRFELIRATAANFSQVFGLFDDAAGETDALFDLITATAPVSHATDADGVESVLWATEDPAICGRVTTILKDKPIFIADGHHRYGTALAYRDLRRTLAFERGESPTDPAYDFVMMALVNMEDPELVVLPTHRVADRRGEFDSAAFYNGLRRHFSVADMPEGSNSDSLADIDGPAFVVKTRTDASPKLVRLRSEIDLNRAISVPRSPAWKRLDVAVLQELVLDPLLGIHPDRPESLSRLRFVKDSDEAVALTPEHDVVFILKATRMQQLREVALAGETMPQKSTYFYPKFLSGLLFRSAE